MAHFSPPPCILPLSQELVYRIAAGEVINSPAAVVRELLDNAIDAQAQRITIDVQPEQGSVRVTDNGKGCTWADLQVAAAPHTTSKLRSREDLSGIQTLGFRGEALHSLAQVGELEICSRPADSDVGWRVQYNHQGQTIEVSQVAIAPGTIVTLTHLFQHWPERHRALPPITQQLRAIQNIIHEHALCHPQITWQTTQGERPWFHIAPGTTAQDILPQILGTLQPGDLKYECIPIETGANTRLEVIMGLPDRCHRSRPDWVRIAVNGRCVQVTSETSTNALRPLEQTILGEFRQSLPRHRFPLCFVHLKIDPQQVDWNRHPAKTEIQLQNLKQWRQLISTALRQALQLPSSTEIEATQTVRRMMKVTEKTGIYQLQQATSLTESVSAEQPEPEDLGLGTLIARAQLHNTYIVAEHPQGMWLIEQHIAHERVLYEQLQQDWTLVTITPPLMISDLTATQVTRLAEIGIDIEAFGHQLWAIRSAPTLLTQREDLVTALVELGHCSDVNSAMVATACRSAIRNGTALTLPEMQRLLDQWQQTQNPRTCPHGRPIFLAMNETNLARFFRRHWVIGKSHGI